jgi:VanZ family protein
MLFARLLPSFGWAFFILLLCGLPPQNTGSFSLWDIFSIDKFLHFAVFAAQALFLIVAIKRQYTLKSLRYYATPIGIALSVLYGIALEYMQMQTIDGRYGEWADMAANTAGSIFGWIIYRIIYGNTIMQAS